MKALVISLAYYLMTVNGISHKNLDIMEKNICNFIWRGHKGQIVWERAILPVSEGGIGAPSVKLRYETTKMSWLKRWWKPEPDRPNWAWIVNEIIFLNASQKPTVDQSTVKEWICQSWRVKTQSNHLPVSVKEMIGAAMKYNAAISVSRAPGKLRLEMPAFYHPFARNKYLRTNSMAMKCLRANHNVRTVEDLV